MFLRPALSFSRPCDRRHEPAHRVELADIQDFEFMRNAVDINANELGSPRLENGLELL